jgi:poly(A) polymerase
VSGFPNIAGAAFLADPGLAAVFDALEQGGDRVRVVGGAVRNAVIGVAVGDIDLATTAKPETVSERARGAGLKAVPTGIDHGTVTVVAEGRPFEVTTLRSDVETFGRRARVVFTGDWLADAERRDFTMNALYADRDGRLHDPVGGLADARVRRVRFIGDPEARIAEDYLRILRFYRFHASYGVGPLDPAGRAATACLARGLSGLSRERVGAEMRKIVLAPGAPEAIVAMAETGVLAATLPGSQGADVFVRLTMLARASGFGPDLEAGLLALGPDTGALADGLRLSNREKNRAEAIAARAGQLGSSPDAAAVRLAVYRDGNDVARAALLLAAARAGVATIPPETLDVAMFWRPPAFPVRAADLIAEGVAPGPRLGAELKAREAAWIAAGYPESFPG